MNSCRQGHGCRTRSDLHRRQDRRICQRHTYWLHPTRQRPLRLLMTASASSWCRGSPFSTSASASTSPASCAAQVASNGVSAGNGGWGYECPQCRYLLVASQNARIALMTSIGVTDRAGSYNRTTEAHDWKRRSERLVRATGLPYTIVRPGWFDYNAPDQHRRGAPQPKRQSMRSAII